MNPETKEQLRVGVRMVFQESGEFYEEVTRRMKAKYPRALRTIQNVNIDMDSEAFKNAMRFHYIVEHEVMTEIFIEVMQQFEFSSEYDKRKFRRALLQLRNYQAAK